MSTADLLTAVTFIRGIPGKEQELQQELLALEVHKMMPHLQASFKRRQEHGWKTEITLWKRVPPAAKTN